MIGLNWDDYLVRGPETVHASLAELTDWWSHGTLRGLEPAYLSPLEEAPALLERVFARESTGKIVLLI